jgi:hypothetical protein
LPDGARLLIDEELDDRLLAEALDVELELLDAGGDDALEPLEALATLLALGLDADEALDAPLPGGVDNELLDG